MKLQLSYQAFLTRNNPRVVSVYFMDVKCSFGFIRKIACITSLGASGKILPVRNLQKQLLMLLYNRDGVD